MEQVPSFTSTETDFFNMIAISNCSSIVLVVTDQSLIDAMGLIALFNRLTQEDVLFYVHLYNHPHINYINFIKTIKANAPMDLSTHVVKGENPDLDLHLYDDESLDIAYVHFQSIVSLSGLFLLLWQKLKCNGTVILKGIKHTDTSRLLEIQSVFAHSIVMSSNVRVTINLLQGSDDMVIIKKPCSTFTIAQCNERRQLEQNVP